MEPTREQAMEFALRSRIAVQLDELAIDNPKVTEMLEQDLAEAAMEMEHEESQ